jgi:hypothetical protein
MQEKRELDSLTQDNKEILALENSNDRKALESERFMEDYKEISEMINELVEESKGGKKTKQAIPKPIDEKISRVEEIQKVPSYIVNLKSLVVSVLSLVSFENYVGYVLLILTLYIAMALMRKYLFPVRPVKKNKKE